MPKKRQRSITNCLNLEAARSTLNVPIQPDNRTGLYQRMEFLIRNETVPVGVSEYVKVPVSALRKLSSLASCSQCHGKCELREDSSKVICIDCDAEVISYAEPMFECPDGRKLKADKLRQIYDTLINGTGFAGYIESCTNLGLSHISKPSYYEYCKFLYQNMEKMWEIHREQLQNSMRHVLHNSEMTCAPDGLLELDVSFDGTWMTRGFRSHIGVGFVIDVIKGFVLDFEVLSNFCQVCNKNKKSKSPKEFDEWKKNHKNCTKNFDGKSGAMEAECALRLWKRSEKLGYRYTGFISDGDSASFKAVSELNGGKGPYASATVTKMECVNHVAKRMGTRLRQLKKNHRQPQKTKKSGATVMRSVYGGRTGLTDADIDRISAHYGQCIRNQQPEGTVDDLRNRILAIYYHASSHDEEPRHGQCPIGENSWCWYQKAIAKNETPASHSSKHLYLSGLSKDLLVNILKIFIDLTSTSLLQRCLQVHTQNRNESLHSKLWRKCLKVKHAYLHRVVFAASVTALIHNAGPVHGSLLHSLGLLTKESIQTKCNQVETIKKSRIVKRKKFADEEPSTSYAPGGF